MTTEATATNEWITLQISGLHPPTDGTRICDNILHPKNRARNIHLLTDQTVYFETDHTIEDIRKLIELAFEYTVEISQIPTEKLSEIREKELGYATWKWRN